MNPFPTHGQWTPRDVRLRHSRLVNALVPIEGAKGYGLVMMVDIFSGVLLGVPFGKHVSSMYHDLSAGRELGQMFIVMDPSRFVGLDAFKASMFTGA